MGALFGEANGFYGRRHTDEVKKRMSEARKGKGCGPKSPETRARMSEAAKRRKRVSHDDREFVVGDNIDVLRALGFLE